MSVTARTTFAADNVRLLTGEFEHFLKAFAQNPPFRESQLDLHVKTLRLRSDARSAAKAVEDQPFLCSLYSTLRAWGIGQRASKLVQLDAFCDRVCAQSSRFAELDGMLIGAPGLQEDQVATAVWSLIRDIGIVENKAPLVAGTKAIHHILPDLVAPIDRMYTRPFFGWYSSQFQYNQEAVWNEVFRAYHQVAAEVDLEHCIDDGWCTARAKLLDNAVVGFCRERHVKRS